MSTVGIWEGTSTRDKTVAEMFANALGCLEDAAHFLQRIDDEFLGRYPADMNPRDPAAPFWYAIAEIIEPLARLHYGLEAVEKYVPKEVTRHGTAPVLLLRVSNHSGG